MDALETIKYLYEHGHKPGREHYMTICAALKPITEHPDVQQIIKETVKLQAENEKLRKELASHRHCDSCKEPMIPKTTCSRCQRLWES